MISHDISPWFPIDNYHPQRAQFPSPPAMRLRSLSHALAEPCARSAAGRDGPRSPPAAHRSAAPLICTAKRGEPKKIGG